MKLSTKLSIMVIALFLVSFGALFSLVYTSTTGIVERNVRERLEGQAFQIIDKVDRMLFERFADMSVLATDTVLRSQTSTTGQITQRLAEYGGKYTIYSSLSLFNMDRVRIADTSGKDIGKQHALTAYWSEIAGGRDMVMAITESQTDKRIIIHFAATVKDKRGRRVGVVASRMPIESIQRIAFETFRSGSGNKSRRVELLDASGKVLYSTDIGKGMFRKRSEDWEYINVLLERGKSVGSARHAFQGEDEITAFARERGHDTFKGSGWVLTLCVPAKIAFAAAHAQAVKFSVLFLAIGLVVIPSTFLLSRAATKPLIELDRAAAEIGRGSRDISVKVRSNDEIGQLARAFNVMAHDLRKSEKKIRDITSSVGEGIYVISGNGEVAFMNPEAERLLGWTEAELLHRNIHDLIHDRKADGSPLPLEECPIVNVIKTGSRFYSRDEIFIRKDGTAFSASVLSTPMMEDGAVVSSVTAFRDITERKRTEGERENLIDELKDALARVKTLSGLLPICASCKKIRDDKGYWSGVESYISRHSEVLFSHGMCPDCAIKAYEELKKLKQGNS